MKPTAQIGIIARSGGYDVSAQAYFDACASAGASIPENRKVLYNDAIKNLKAQSIWNELDSLYIWAAASQTAALIDVRNPARIATVVNDYAGAFVVDNYFKGNGTNFRIDLGYNPGDGGTYKAIQDSNSFGVYFNTHVNETKADLSAQNGSSIGVEILSLVGNFSLSGKDNNATLRSVANYTNRGLSSMKRTAANSWEHQKNGYQMYGASSKETDVSQPVSNATFQAFCRNVNGTYTQFSTKKIAYAFAGSSNIDHFTLNTIVEQYFLNPLSLIPLKRITFNGNSFTSTGTYTKRVLVDLTNAYDSYEINNRGLSGNTTVQIQTDAVNTVFNRTKSYLTKDIYFFWELTNDMTSTSSDVSLCYTHLVNYLTALRAAQPNGKIIVATCMPRLEGAFVNANRQNDANLYDDTTLNGKIRNHIVQDGYADAICDTASDPIMGIYSNGVAGIGEKNTTYYSADEIHPTTTGYNYLADNYIYPSINALI